MRQHYGNHRRYYLPHHFLLYPACILLTIVCAAGIFRFPENQYVWMALTALSFLLLLTGYLMRQHYALGNQNRIVRLEMRLRYYQLTGERFEPLEERLGFGRIAALRFASDSELVPLIRRSLDENLSAKAIKQAIRHWYADETRV